MGDPGRARHRLPRPGGPFPRGWEGAAWCAVRPHPPHPRTARRRDEHSDLGPGERNGPPPAPGAPPPGPDVLLRPPPQPLGRRSEREHQPPPRAATCPKAPPSPATNPYPGRHRRRTGQLPPRYPRLPHPTRSIHSTHCHHPSSLVRKKSELTAEQYAHQRKMLIVSGAIMVVCIAAIVGILNLIG